MDHEERNGVSFDHMTRPPAAAFLLLSTIAPTEYMCKPGSMWSTNKAANTEYLSDHRAAAMLSAASSCSCLRGASWRIWSCWVGYFKCPGLPHQWCRILEQRQANPLSRCALCVWQCVCGRSGRRQTEAERETGLGYRQLLRVCTVCVEPWEASRIPPHHFHFITPGADIHYSALQASVHRDR